MMKAVPCCANWVAPGFKLVFCPWTTARTQKCTRDMAQESKSSGKCLNTTASYMKQPTTTRLFWMEWSHSHLSLSSASFCSLCQPSYRLYIKAELPVTLALNKAQTKAARRAEESLTEFPKALYLR